MTGTTDTDNITEERVSPAAEEMGIGTALWKVFSSMKTAIVLLLLLAAVSTVATILESRHGHTNIYHSIPYAFLLSLIGVNLAVCSINRFGLAWRRTFASDTSADAKRVTGMRRSESLISSGSVEEVSEKVLTALRSASYHVVGARDGEDATVYAAKGRLSIWGPYLTHVSILVIFAGAIFGGRMGFHGYTAIPEGDYAEVCYLDGTREPKEFGFRVALNDFTIEYDDQRHVTGYKSDLSVYEGDELAARKVIDVNHPLTYKGISFFQSSYGISHVVVKVTSPDGKAERFDVEIGTRSGPHGNQYLIAGEPWHEVKFGEKKLTMYVHSFVPDYVGGEAVNASSLPLNPAIQAMVNDRFPEYKELDGWTKLDWLPVSGSAEYKGFTIELEKAVDYTGLQVSKNPGLPIIYSGFGLMLLGVFISFYITHRIIRVRVSRSGEGVTVLVGGSSRSDTSIFDRDFERIRESL